MTATTPTTTGTENRTPPPHRHATLVRLLLVTMALIASTLIPAAPAIADTHAGYFSDFFPLPSPTAREDCNIYSGIAKDNLHTYPNYHYFGAGEVYCRGSHRLSLHVSQERRAYGVIRAVTSTSWYGTTNRVYLPTGPACKNGDPNASFRTRVYVYIDGRGYGWFYSPWRTDPSGGCRYL